MWAKCWSWRRPSSMPFGPHLIGPAFVALVAEAMAEAVAAGLPRDLALRLSHRTLAGTAELWTARSAPCPAQGHGHFSRGHHHRRRPRTGTHRSPLRLDRAVVAAAERAESWLRAAPPAIPDGSTAARSRGGVRPLRHLRRRSAGRASRPVRQTVLAAANLVASAGVAPNSSADPASAGPELAPSLRRCPAPAQLLGRVWAGAQQQLVLLQSKGPEAGSRGCRAGGDAGDP